MNDAPTPEDHYATLGVAPRSEDVVIRAAYLALMHRYHPDKSSSPASAERAQAIIAAFAVLGDAEKRLEYDWGRRRAAEELARPRPRQRPLPGLQRGLAATAAVLVLIVPLALMRIPPTPADRPVASAREAQPLVPPPSAATVMPKADLPARPVAAVAPPKATEPDQPESSVATARQAAAPPPRPAKIVPVAPPVRSPAASVASADKPVASANSNCPSPAPGGGTAACKDDNLAALDRLALAFYGQSLRTGNATKRAALLASRNSFLGRLQACRSEPCLRSAYLTHMREISSIVESKPQP